MADLIRTKLAAPRPRRGLVARSRVIERLRNADEARLVLVAAPAGFGKTTLLTEWLAGPGLRDHAVAWLSLDAGDREPASFWTYVAGALRSALPDLDSEALGGLTGTSAPAEPLLTAMLNDLANASRSVWLVLDDFHLADGPAVAEGMTFLLDHLPAPLHVVISTRADPGLPLARCRARGELLEVRAGDLRFTADESVAYLAAAGLDLAPRDVEALEARTEGWVTALQLAALSLQGRADPSGFVARFAGDDRYVVDYLVEEVLAHQPPAVREFLLRSSVLDRLTGPLCDALTDRHDGADRLVALERANVFLVGLDDHREWFRYHHLFADVLRAQLLREQPDEVPRLHQRASAWYEAQGLVEEAVRHALAAEDHDRAARLMEAALPAIRRDRQDALALGWLRALPEDAVERSPVLTVFAAYGRLVVGDLAGAEAGFAHAEQALAADPGGEDARRAAGGELATLPATIAVYRASVAQARGDVAATVVQAQRALDLAGPDDHLARGGAAGFLGLAAWAAGDVTTALRTFGQAVASLHAAGNLVDELTSTVVLADLWTTAGRPSRARRLCEAALRTAGSGGAPVARAVADLQVALAELALRAGDAAAARRHLEAAADGGEPAGMAESRYRWFVASALLAEAEGDADAAADLLDAGEEAYHPGFFPDLRPIAAIRARLLIAHGDLVGAEAWAQQRGVTAADAPDHRREAEHLTLVRLLLARHREGRSPEAARDALDLLQRLLDAAEGSGREASLLEIRVLQAMALDAQGRRARAAEALGRALDLAPEPRGSARVLLDEGAPMTDLLGEAVQRGLGGGDARLLLHLGERPAAARPSTAEGLSERELQVLRLLDTESSGPEIARALFVSQNTLRSHTKHIFTKLDVTSRRAAVLRARERGLL